jgi:hypothetical protein
MTELNRAPGGEPCVPTRSEGSTSMGTLTPKRLIFTFVGLNTRSALKKGIAAICALCGLMVYVIVVAPPALATSKSSSATLKNWYQQTGHPVLERFLADGQRLDEVNASTTAHVERQDCNDVKRDAISASDGKSPPQPVLAQEYRYFLLAAAKSFTQCMTGISSSNYGEVFEGVQGGAQAVGAAIKIIKGAQNGRVVAVPPSSVNLKPPIPASVFVPECQSDFKFLDVAIAAYNAQNSASPVPPAPWSASTYIHNFAPLQNSKNGGPFMNQPFDTTHYVLEYDSSGNVWVEPPGQYDPSYNPAHGSPDACAAVVK